MNGQGFADSVDTSIAAYSPEPISPRDRVLRLNNILILAAKTHVGKSKIGRYIKPWSTPELLAAIKRRNNLRRTVTENRTECLEASTKVRKFTEEARQTTWEQFSCKADCIATTSRAGAVLLARLRSGYTPLCKEELQALEQWLQRCPNLDILQQHTIGIPSPPLGVLTTDPEKMLALARATYLSHRRPPQQQQRCVKPLNSKKS